MSKLTDTQLNVLSKAARRADGAAVAPDRANKSAAAKIAASLMRQKLMREISSKAGMPVWRKGEDNRNFSLVITRAGKQAIGVVDEKSRNRSTPARKSVNAVRNTFAPNPPAKIAAAKLRATEQEADKPVCIPAAAASIEPGKTVVSFPAPDQPRAGSKQALLVNMLLCPEGATIGAMIKATGWLPHTTRAALTGLRKRGFAITLTSRESEASVYAIPALRGLLAATQVAKNGKRA